MLALEHSRFVANIGMIGIMAAQKKLTFDLVTGDILARPVFTRTGDVLLDADSLLTPDRIEKIETWGINEVFVKETEEDDVNKVASEIELEGTDDSDGITLEIGTLEPEEPVPWDEIAEEDDIEVTEELTESVEARIEERIRERPPLTRKPPELKPFVYDAEEVAETKKLLHNVHRKTVAETTKAVTNIARRNDGNVDLLRQLIVNLVDTGVSNREIMGALSSLTRFDDFLLSHTIRTTVYAILTGYSMGLSQTELYELAECTLLHDIGMSRISPAVWKKPSRINQNEMLEIQKHTILGADILSDAKRISFFAEIVAYQHHERFDGSGYPKGKKGVRIHEYSRIVALVDVFAAMTARRPHRDRHLGYEAMQHILASSSFLFDPAVVKAFLRCMALYPLGSMVELSNHAQGIVIAANPLFPFRPQIKVTRDEKGTFAGGAGDVVDLLKEKSLSITRPLSDDSMSDEEIWKSI